MDAAYRVHLRVVSSASVFPHEIADPVREERIEQRLRLEGILRDPVMVGAVPDVDGFVLLDGTNRQRALRTLNLPWILVQVLDYADQYAVQLHAWCHLVQLDIEDIVKASQSICGLEMDPLSPLEASDALGQSTTLALLLARGTRFALRRRPDHALSRADQLCQLVNAYERHMTRIDCDPEQVEERAHSLSAQDDRPTLVAFPPFTRSQVVSMALQGALIPAGITRHVVLGGRALRVNVPLSMLSSDNSLGHANDALLEHLSTLQPRQYREPTILYDS
jgi:hypothetical protein